MTTLIGRRPGQTFSHDDVPVVGASISDRHKGNARRHARFAMELP